MSLSNNKVVWVCGLLMSVTAFSVDITLPLFGLMSQDLGAPLERLPLTVTTFLTFLGLGQLLFGILSDRFGRRAILFTGLTIYLIGTIVAGFANSLELLVIARGIQGLGAAAPHILSRTIIRDLYTGIELAKKMAVASAIFSVGPILAPLAGALLLEAQLAWQWAFVFNGIFAVSLIIIIRYIAEPNQSYDTNATNLETIISNVRHVITHPQSRTFILISTISNVSAVIIISMSAPIYTNTFSLTGLAFALYYSVHGLGIIFGQMVNHALLGRIGILKTTTIANYLMLFSAIGVCLIAKLGFASPVVLSLLISLFFAGYLSVIANATSLLLQSHANMIGFAAALQGTITMTSSSLIVGVLAGIIDGDLFTFGLAITIAQILVMLVLYRYSKKNHSHA